MVNKNKSERVFERYLNSNGFKGKWDYEPSVPGKNKKPDYLLIWKGDKYFLEVKELKKKANQQTGKAAWIDPYSSLRSVINEARKKFKEYKDHSCSLVVFNVNDLHVRLGPIYVFGAMLGNLGFSMGFDSTEGKAIEGTDKNVFLNNGKMINNKRNQPQNTTINAVVVLNEFLDNREVEKALRKEERKQNKKFTLPEKLDIRMKLYENHHVKSVPRVVVIENPVARMPFPADLLNGPFDEHWKMQNDKPERVFAGSKLKELESLQGKS